MNELHKWIHTVEVWLMNADHRVHSVRVMANNDYNNDSLVNPEEVTVVQINLGQLEDMETWFLDRYENDPVTAVKLAFADLALWDSRHILQTKITEGLRDYKDRSCHAD